MKFYEGSGDVIHSIGKVNTSSPFIPRAGKSNIEWAAVDYILKAYQKNHPIIHLMKLDLHGAEWEVRKYLFAGTESMHNYIVPIIWLKMIF